MNAKQMKYLKIVFAIFLSISSVLHVQAQVEKKFIDENTGVSGTIGPTIPEPLNFDLVRPLGAKKGEIEINTIGLMNISRDELFSWGPEIEFVIKDGYAMEFELPFGNNNLEELKLAFQGTISDDPNNSFIHGWQTIQKAKLDNYFWQSDYLYIHGYRFNKDWSTLSLTGFRQDLFNNGYGSSLLNNTSFFRAINSKVTLGLETNWLFENINLKNSQNKITILPQAHFELDDNYSIQVGAGVSRNDQTWGTVIASRFIVEF